MREILEDAVAFYGRIIEMLQALPDEAREEVTAEILQMLRGSELHLIQGGAENSPMAVNERIERIRSERRSKIQLVHGQRSGKAPAVAVRP